LTDPLLIGATVPLHSVELFGGAGGLALGLHEAGFSTRAFVEWDRWACDTVRENAHGEFPDLKSWQVHEGDVRDIDWSDLASEDISLVSGGPPCQPFSLGGRARAADDSRDMFPAAADVVRRLNPRAFIFENVKGLTRAAFSEYLELVVRRLQSPKLSARPGESWTDHLDRLRILEGRTRSFAPEYTVHLTSVNAADFGVPQQRHRVLFVGLRTDLTTPWVPPAQTHSLDALLFDQWVSGEYWERHKVPLRHRPEPPARHQTRISRLRSGEVQPSHKAWVTVRDALQGLPEPTINGSHAWLNHVLQPGARSYPGHDGSPIDLPAKTLKAGGHGVPGGENMLRRPDGSIRYFSIRESARLQTFPDRYRLHGSWGEAMRQLGNAVPVALATTFGLSVHQALEPHIPKELSLPKSA
jgi:DNA (cytosine-5)-methyltransferase 1